jgi:hypothetical protein
MKEMGIDIKDLDSMIQCPKCGALHPKSKKQCDYCGLDLMLTPQTPPLEHKSDRLFVTELRDGEQVDALRVKTTTDRIVEIIQAHDYAVYEYGWKPVGSSPNLKNRKRQESWVYIIDETISTRVVKKFAEEASFNKRKLGPFTWTQKTRTKTPYEETVKDTVRQVVAKMTYFDVGHWSYGNNRYNDEAFFYLQAVNPEEMMPMAQAISALPDVDRLRMSEWECHKWCKDFARRSRKPDNKHEEQRQGHSRYCLFFYRSLEDLKSEHKRDI